jgi:hypothetical protein
LSDQPMPRTEAQRRLEQTLDRASSTLITMAGPDVPNFGNMTPQQLVDEAAIMGEVHRRAEQAQKTFKEVLKTKLEGAKTLRGDKYEVNITSSPREALDQTKAKEVLTEVGRLTECMKVTEVDTMRFKEL